ncbi:MAG: hypothetical protein ACOYXY_18875 [Thermodesulfobacteriota bacterium]
MPKLIENNPSTLTLDFRSVGVRLNGYASDVSAARICLRELERTLARPVDVLNRAFVFEGYEGRTREALLDILLHYAFDENANLRREIYESLGRVAPPEFLVQRAFQEIDNSTAFIGIIFGLEHATEGMSVREKNTLALRLRDLLETHTRLSSELLSGFILNLGTRFSVTTVLSDVAEKRDFDRAVYILGSITVLRYYRGVDARTFARFIATAAMSDDFPSRFFEDDLSYIDISALLDHLDDRTISRLTVIAEERLERLGYGENLFFLAGCAFFKHAAAGTLIETEVGNQKIRFFTLPEELLKTTGMVILNICVVSESVPEKLRPIVAYHEHVEGQTRSHERALAAELKAVRSLGLQKEYIEWVESKVDVMNGRVELLERLKGTSKSSSGTPPSHRSPL